MTSQTRRSDPARKASDPGMKRRFGQGWIVFCLFDEHALDVFRDTLNGMPLSYNIADGLTLGFVAYPLIILFSGKVKEINPLIFIVGVLFFLRYALIKL